MTLIQELFGRVYWQEKRWKISIQKDGKRKTFYSSTPGPKGRRECAAKAAAWLASPETATLDSRTTVDTVFQQYLKDKELETTDVYNIRNRYKNHIKPVIGSTRLSHLTPQDLKKVITTAHSKAGLAKKSLLNLRGDLSGFCAYLDNANIRHDLSTRNIKIPKNAKRSEKHPLALEDIKKVFSCSTTLFRKEEAEDWLACAYRFQIVTGLRPGELMGLEWGDIKDDHIEIRRAINAKGAKTNGKNEFAERDFPQTKYTRQLLQAQARYRRNPHNPHERVFGDQGQISYRDRWSIFCEFNGIDYVTPYELRHTFASIYNDKLPVWILDELMGHTHEGVSLGIYAHTLGHEMMEVPAILDKALDSILV